MATASINMAVAIVIPALPDCGKQVRHTPIISIVVSRYSILKRPVPLYSAFSEIEPRFLSRKTRSSAVATLARSETTSAINIESGTSAVACDRPFCKSLLRRTNRAMSWLRNSPLIGFGGSQRNFS